MTRKTKTQDEKEEITGEDGRFEGQKKGKKLSPNRLSRMGYSIAYET